MSKIFFASADVSFLGEHAYLVFDQDGDLSTLHDQLIYRGGPKNDDILDFESIILEPGFLNYNTSNPTSTSEDSLDENKDGVVDNGDDTVIDRHYYDIQSISAVGDIAIINNWINSFNTPISTGSDVGKIDTGIDYILGSQNSNSIIGTALSLIGFNFNTITDNYSGPSAHQFIAWNKFIDGKNDEILTFFSGQDNSIAHTYDYLDNEGNDYLIVENGATVNLTKDNDTTTWNNVVLSGYSSLNGLYFDRDFLNNNLDVRESVGLDSTIVSIEQHFDSTGGYNTKYLFVVDGDVDSENINISLDTISGAGISVLKQIDTRLLDGVDWSLFGRIYLEAVHTAHENNADITGSDDDDFMFGDGQDNVIEGQSGSDYILGGAGNDFILINASSSDSYSYIDGGSDADSFGYTGSTNVVVKGTTIRTQSSLAENIESIRLGTNSSKYIYATDVGRVYDANNATDVSWVDYSSSNESLNFNLALPSWEVQKSVSSDTDFYNNVLNANAQFIGTVHGDTIIIGDNNTNIWLGTGNDTVSIAGGTSKTVKLYYSDGNDIVNSGDAVDFIIFDSSIQGSAVSFSSTNIGSVVNHGSFKTYNFDLVANINGKGSITLENLTATITAGADGVLDTADDLFYRSGGIFRLWNNSYYNDDNFLIGSESFVKLDSTPFDNSSITGTSGKEDLKGYGGDDTLSGGAGNDRIYGNGGDDTLNGGAGDDDLYGDLGEDSLNGDAGNDTIYGGEGNDIIYGGEGNDTIYGHNGDDVLIGGEGAGYIYGGFGEDIISIEGGFAYGDDGNDTITATNALHVDGGDGNDTITATNALYIYGGNGDDVLNLFGGADVFGGDGDDYIYASGSGTKYQIHAGLGNNHVDLSDSTTTFNFIGLDGGNNQIHDSSGVDFIDIEDKKFGQNIIHHIGNGDGDNVRILADGLSSVDEVVFTVDENDLIISSFYDPNDYIRIIDHLIDSSPIKTLYTPSTGSTLKIKDFNDWILGSDQGEIVSGTVFKDVIVSNGGGDTIYGYEGDDYIYGSNQDDFIVGGLGLDRMYGGGGDDIYFFEKQDFQNADAIYDRSGNDRILLGSTISISDVSIYSSNISDIVVEVEGKRIVLNSQLYEQTFYSNIFIENLEFSNGYIFDLENYQNWNNYNSSLNIIHTGVSDNEVIIGSLGGDILKGDSGDDIIIGGDSDDEIVGGLGDDTLTGGDGDDIFIFNSLAEITANTDHITDLELGDKIDLSAISGLTFIGLAEFSNSVNEVRYALDNGTTVIEIDSTGDGERDHRIVIDNGEFQIVEDSIFTSVFNRTDAILIAGTINDDTLIGTSLNEMFVGLKGNDTLNGGDGVDRVDYSDAASGVMVNLHAGTATDSYGDTDTLLGIEEITGSDFDDLLVGSNTDDNTIWGGLGVDNIQGRDGDDFLYGEGGDDELLGGNGNDTLDGGDGVDSLYGNDGDDTIHGGLGNDRLYGYADNDTLNGDDGDDKIYAGLGNDNVDGGAGVDQIWGEDGDDTINGGLDDDIIKGGIGADTLYGDAGNDDVDGQDGVDTVYGGAGEDTLNGGDGADTLYGGDDDDLLFGGGESDILYGDAGDDLIYGNADADIINGGDGADELSGGDGDDTINGGNGNDFLIGGIHVDTLNGDAGDDTLWGENGNDILHGGLDNDLLRGGNGHDYLYGDEGDDYIRGENHNDRLYGGSGDDELFGDTGNDVLRGEDGLDTLRAGDGNDVLYGGDGFDKLFGNAGADTFVFEAASAYNDRDDVRDFSLADGDKIDLSDLLAGYDPLNDLITDFVQITDNGTHSYVAVDADGGADNFLQVAQIVSVTGLTDESTLEANGTLIV